MTASVGTSAGAVYVDIVPDYSAFARGFRTRMKAISEANPVRVDVDVDTTKIRSNVRKVKTDVDRAGDDIGQSFGKQMFGKVLGLLPGFLGNLPPLAAGPVAVAGAAIGVMLGSAIGAAAVAGILLAVGGGVLAIGIKSAANDPRVKAAFGEFGEKAKKIFADFGKPFVAPLIRAADTFSAALERMAPKFQVLAQRAAPIIDKLAPALATMAERALPGIQAALEGAQPIFDALAESAPIFGDAISKFFSSIAEGGPGAATFIKDLFRFMAWIIPIIGEFLGDMAESYGKSRAQAITAINAVRDAWHWFWDDHVLPIFRNIRTWTTETVPNAFRDMRDRTTARITEIRDRVRDRVNGVLGFFRNVRDFITVDVPNAFVKFRDLVGQRMDEARAKIGRPIRIVVETVLNKGIIGGFNWVADKLGLDKFKVDPVPLGDLARYRDGGLARFQDGGILPGPKGLRRKDNMLAMVQSGEYYMPVDRTKKYLPYLEAMRNGTFPGFADGGLIDLITNPLRWVGGRLSNTLLDPLRREFGDNIAVRLATGMLGKGKDMLGEAVKNLVSKWTGIDSLTGAAKGVASYAGLQPKMLALALQMRALFGNNGRLISGFRFMSRTLSGRLSRHALGLAGDFPAYRPLAEFIHAAYGGRLLELITPWQDLNMYRGRPHIYTGAVWNQHNFPGGNAHVHAGFKNGGRVPFRPLFARTYDTGGWLMPGQLAYNGSSRPEAVFNDRQLAMLSEGSGRTPVAVAINYPPSIPPEEAFRRQMERLDLLGPM